MEQALRYKFKPLAVDGIAVQMEMPLVLHFVSKIADPLAMLKGQELLKQISGCDAKLVSEMPSSNALGWSRQLTMDLENQRLALVLVILREDKPSQCASLAFQALRKQSHEAILAAEAPPYGRR
jgi:hypothetical protein